VFQGETYAEEKLGGYVWSPQRNKNGRKNAGYTTMTNIHKGDIIFHNSNGKFMAIGVATSNCYEAVQPEELVRANTTIDWEKSGYRVDVRYFELDTPLKVTEFKEWLQKHYLVGSAFTKNGTGKQQYMCSLADEHAIFLLEKAIGLQKSEQTVKKLKQFLDDIKGAVI